MPKPSPRPFLDADKAEAAEFAKRARDRMNGTHKPAPLKRLPKLKLKLKHHLVIGDSHAHPDDPNHRFEWLGSMILDRKPDTVVDIGDSADMPSLFSYDRGAIGPKVEAARYWQDIDAYHDAQERLRQGMGKYRPTRMVKTKGNHEERIERMLAATPLFRGVLDPSNLLEEHYGWETHPYGVPVNIDGILYCHAFKNPGNGREISGVMAARRMVIDLPGSACRVQGHSHKLQYWETSDEAGGAEPHCLKITGIHGGCYFDLASNAHYWAGRSVNGWRSGILELWVLGGQIHDFQWTSYDRVRALYG